MISPLKGKGLSSPEISLMSKREGKGIDSRREGYNVNVLHKKTGETISRPPENNTSLSNPSSTSQARTGRRNTSIHDLFFKNELDNTAISPNKELSDKKLFCNLHQTLLSNFFFTYLLFPTCCSHYF